MEGPCPALEWREGRYWCGLLAGGHRHVPGLRDTPWVDPVIRDMVLQTGAFGVGCDSDQPAEIWPYSTLVRVSAILVAPGSRSLRQ